MLGFIPEGGTDQKSWHDIFLMHIVLSWYELPMNEIWSDLDDPGGLGRRGAPDFCRGHTFRPTQRVYCFLSPKPVGEA